MKILSKKITPSYENGLRVESNRFKHEFNMEEELEDKKCCTIL